MKKEHSNKFDLGWGDPVVVRQALFQFDIPIIQSNSEAYGYTNNSQREEIYHNCKLLNRHFFSRDYKYVVITVGAMQALQGLCDYYKQCGYTGLRADKTYFPYYPEAAKRNNLRFNSIYKSTRDIRIIDSPSNPKGMVTSSEEFIEIWDAVYNNNIYKTIKSVPLRNAAVVIGSFGKLFGLSGLRLGWVSTDNENIYKHLKHYVEVNTCSLPTPSVVMVNQIVKGYLTDWGINYENLARSYIDRNREELCKVLNIFDNQKISTNGMFYFPKCSIKARKILDKADIRYVEGSSCGDKESIRLNLAQDNLLTKQAIQQIKRVDLWQKMK